MGKKKSKKQAYHSEWICDDRPRPMCPEIAALTDEENEVLFLILFGKNLNTPPKCVVWSALQHWCGEKSLQHFCGLLQLLVWFRFNS